MTRRTPFSIRVDLWHPRIVAQVNRVPTSQCSPAHHVASPRLALPYRRMSVVRDAPRHPQSQRSRRANGAEGYAGTAPVSSLDAIHGARGDV
ncbi:hypothetical protein EVG20_g10730 [Dentipellis fragilis]|uniref:Uncharacterized protein n=1 Tax=Dentipellis fragilis TaxID=205917 RepID=A0A4Y9XPI7_9AGAM|nr:hypothetical protein EVG20_g10730 [Dentipellis fragilis]